MPTAKKMWVNYIPTAEEFDTLLAFVGGCQELVEDFHKASKSRTAEAQTAFSKTLESVLEVAIEVKRVSDKVKLDAIELAKKSKELPHV
jgi:hypothetical protein